MTARAPDDHTSDVRGLLAELGELVGDLGLDEPVEPARPAAIAPPAAEEVNAADPTRSRRSRRRQRVPSEAQPCGSAADATPLATQGFSAEAPQAEEHTAADLAAEAPQAEEPAAEDLAAEALQAERLQAEEPTAEDLAAEAPQAAAMQAEAPAVEAPQADKPAAEAPQSDEPAAELDEADAETAAPLLPDDVAELAELAAAMVAPVGGADSSDLVPLWEPAAEDEPVTLVPLWDAFAPELDADPPRAWSLAAAMEVVEPAAPPAPPTDGTGRRGRLSRLRPRLFTITTAAAVLVAAAVVVLTHLDLGHTAGPAKPVAGQPFQVTLMRTVDATSASTVAEAPTVSHFPPHTAQVYMDVVYRNIAQGDRLRLVIDLLPPAGSGGNPVQVGDQTHLLPPGGEIAVTIQGPSTGFSPGDYTVTAFHDGHLEQSVNFTIDAAPAASPTP